MNKEKLLYKIVSYDSDFKQGYPEELTTVLGNEIGKTYANYDYKNHRYICTWINNDFNIYDELKEKDKEIQRLNNIIDELEEYILNHYIVGHIIQNASLDDILNKLKELKEGKQ